MNNLRRFAQDVIGTYVEMGTSALERGEYQIAYKMYRAAFEEPSSRVQKNKFLGELLVNMARTHEGLRQLYKAKLLYIRALAHHKRQGFANDSVQAELLIRLARLTAEQGLYKQSAEFASQARDCVTANPSAASSKFQADMACLRSIYESRSRTAELKVLPTEELLVDCSPVQTTPVSF